MSNFGVFIKYIYVEKIIDVFWAFEEKDQGCIWLDAYAGTYKLVFQCKEIIPSFPYLSSLKGPYNLLCFWMCWTDLD